LVAAQSFVIALSDMLVAAQSIVIAQGDNA
jgi:hypothetical protein